MGEQQACPAVLRRWLEHIGNGMPRLMTIMNRTRLTGELASKKSRHDNVSAFLFLFYALLMFSEQTAVSPTLAAYVLFLFESTASVPILFA